MTFKEIGLHNHLLKTLDRLGFVNPTEIQQEAIPFLLRESNRDLIALAQTGTGKTASFALPILHHIDSDQNTVQALVLCPTRELCNQIARDIDTFAEGSDISTVAVYGGASASVQKKQLRQGAQIVVGTPGRTLDLIRQKILDVRNIKWLVLDEADEMLNMGFKEELENILKNTPQDKQNLLFSATMPKAMKGIVADFMTDPHSIQVSRQNIGASNIVHQYYVCHAKNKYLTLQRLVDANPQIYGIIFCRTRRETQYIADELMQRGYNADTLHGDINQSQREVVMNNFKNKTIQLLVATDVAARGIDVDDLTHVINYQLPDDPEVYIHRSGRTGRAGKSGVSMSIIHSREMNRIHTIEKMVGKNFSQESIPTGQEICAEQIHQFLIQIKNHQPNGNLIEEYWPIIEDEIGSLKSEEIINRLLSIEINGFIQEYQNAPDLNITKNKSSAKGGKHVPDGNTWVGYEFTSGRKQNMNPKRLIALINDQTDSHDITIGDIIIKNRFSYFEVHSEDAPRLEEAFRHLEKEGSSPLSRAKVKPSNSTKNKKGSYSRKKKGSGSRRNRGKKSKANRSY